MLLLVPRELAFGSLKPAALHNPLPEKVLVGPEIICGRVGGAIHDHQIAVAAEIARYVDGAGIGSQTATSAICACAEL